MTAQSAGAHILVVDDNEINRDLLKLKLEMAGYRVTTVDDGHQAISRLKPHAGGEEYDVVLLDVMMPDISGMDVLRQVRQSQNISELPIIMVTARDASEDVVEALNCGANDYVTKPIDFPVLFARLQAALQLRTLSRQKDEFLSIASHDLKNPLSVIRGMLKLVAMTVPEGEPMNAEASRFLKRAQVQTQTMERIISDFLDFQAMEDGQLSLKKSTVSVSAVARSVADELSIYAADKEIELRTELPDGLPLVVADAARIKQVLLNFVGNAIKFSESGSVVTIAASADGRFRTTVSDQGPGIAPDDRPKLFRKYAKLTNRPTGGEKSSGLGLAICKTIIELHGGKVGAESHEPAPGSTFWFTLPLAKE